MTVGFRDSMIRHGVKIDNGFEILAEKPN